MSNVVLSKSFQRVKIRYLFIFNDNILFIQDKLNNLFLMNGIFKIIRK